MVLTAIASSSAVSLLGQFRHEVVITLMVTAFLAAVSYPFRKAKEEWFALITKLDGVRNELEHQRSNCLTTLQSQGEKQIEFLKQAVDVLTEIRLDNREIVTHLRDKV
jgi:hypothetical protein